MRSQEGTPGVERKGRGEKRRRRERELERRVEAEGEEQPLFLPTHPFMASALEE